MRKVFTTGSYHIMPGNLRRVTSVKSQIINKIQYFLLSVEGDSETYRCDLAMLKYRYRIEADEVELLIGKEIVVPHSKNSVVKSWEFYEHEMYSINRNQMHSRINFERIGFIHTYEPTNGKSSKIALVTTKGSAVFLKVEDFKSLTDLELHENQYALGCYLWSPYFEILEDKKQWEDIYNQTIADPKEIAFRYFDTYDKLRINYNSRIDAYLYENQGQIKRNYHELRREKLFDKRTEFPPSYNSLGDALDGFPDAKWNID